MEALCECLLSDNNCPVQPIQLENGFSEIPVASQLFALDNNAKSVGQVTSSVYNIGLARVELASAFPNVGSGMLSLQIRNSS